MLDGLTILELNRENMEIFSDLLSPDAMGDLELKGCYGLGAALLQENGKYAACGALVYMMELPEEEHGVLSEIRWLYVGEAVRRQGIAEELINRFFEIQNDLDTENIFCRIPLSSECDEITRYLEDVGFYFAIAPCDKMVVGKQDVLSHIPRRVNPVGAYIVPLGEDHDQALGEYLMEHDLAQWVDDTWFEEGRFFSYDRNLSSLCIRDGKIRGVFLCDLDGRGQVTCYALNTDDPAQGEMKTVRELIQRSAEAFYDTKEADSVCVYVRSPGAAKICKLLFPELELIDVRAGVYAGEEALEELFEEEEYEDEDYEEEDYRDEETEEEKEE